ncbi:MAG: hypothetical protein LC790_13155 [Actinobacteria bacterium]|nr:hypothetical protein [Actinomycetota bacterium]
MGQDGQRKTCSICGAEGKLTKEHLWSAWIGELFEFPDRTSPHVRFFREPGQELQGHRWDMPAFEQRVTAPCRRCNNGWMSQLEMAAKPLMTPLIGGFRAWLDPAAQHALAVWAIKTTMMSAYVYPRAHNAIAREDYTWLYENRTPPPDYQVWIGKRANEGDEWPAFFRHCAMTATLGGQELPPPGDPNAHRTTVGVGHLFLHVFGHHIANGPSPDLTGYESALARIWPTTGGHRVAATGNARDGGDPEAHTVLGRAAA